MNKEKLKRSFRRRSFMRQAGFSVASYARTSAKASIYGGGSDYGDAADEAAIAIAMRRSGYPVSREEIKEKLLKMVRLS